VEKVYGPALFATCDFIALFAIASWQANEMHPQQNYARITKISD